VKSQNRAWPQLCLPAVSIHFPRAGKNVLSYACLRRTSFVSRFVHRAVRSRPSFLPKVDSRALRRSLLPRVLAVVLKRGRPAEACSRRTESPNGAQSRRSCAANGQEGITPLPDSLIHEKSMAEGKKNAPLKNLPYPFTGFGPQDSSEQERIPFPPSPVVPEECAGSLEARECQDSVGCLPHHLLSRVSGRHYLAHATAAQLLARESAALSAPSPARNTSTGSGSGSGVSSRHNSHVSVSSASLALGCEHAHSLIHGIDGASRSSKSVGNLRGFSGPAETYTGFSVS